MKLKTLSEQEAYEKAATYCVRREHCTKDVERKLYEWQVDKAYWSAILTKLQERGFIDDARFARAFTRDKHLYSGWGQVRIKQELRARSISQTYITEALQTLFDEHEEEDQLLRVLQTKLRTLKAQDPLRKRRDQLIRFALYRGYPYDSIRQALSKLNIDADEHNNE